MRVVMMTWIMVMMMMMVTLSDTVSMGEIAEFKIDSSKDRKARQNDGEDGTKEGDIENSLEISIIRK